MGELMRLAFVAGVRAALDLLKVGVSVAQLADAAETVMAAVEKAAPR